MTHEFKRAVREEVGLLIGLIGPSGSGKTYSAMRLASGIVGAGKSFAVIDTESRRALHYADAFSFDHCELHPPFRPDAYADAIQAADKAGYRAIVVDSMSHEWAGEGGILDWQDEELTRMAGDDYRKREACKMAAWIKPKMGHKQMVQRLLQVKAHLILCFRAEEKMKMEKDANGKTQIVPIGFQPICSKELPYELTVSFLLNADKPGVGQPIKLQEQHTAIFPTGKLIDETSGGSVSEWAKGGAKKPVSPPPPVSTNAEKPAKAEKPADGKGAASRKALEARIGEMGIDRETFKEWLDTIGWLQINDDGRRSMKDLSDSHVKYLLDKWDSATAKFNAWVDKMNAAPTE
jgi:hypothetical protein